MASNLQNQGLLNIGKRLIGQIGQIGYRNLNPSLSSSLLLRRRVQVSAYDKNPDEPIHNPSLIPDEAISPNSDKYWAPHPKTGVFSPSSENPALTAEEHGFRGDNNAGSVLEEKAFFRPLEDLEKPAPN